jgi:hypothetical protein
MTFFPKYLDGLENRTFVCRRCLYVSIYDGVQVSTGVEESTGFRYRMCSSQCVISLGASLLGKGLVQPPGRHLARQKPVYKPIPSRKQSLKNCHS